MDEMRDEAMQADRIADQNQWELLIADVAAMMHLHEYMDGNDRLEFARSLRKLAAREELAGISQNRFEPPTPDTPQRREDMA